MADFSTPNAPRGILTVNGTSVSGAIKSFDVDNNNYFAPDTFRIELVLAAMPTQFNAAFWSDSQAQIGISAALNVTDAPTQLILGNADTIDLDIPNGTVSASGRDLSAALIDAKTNQKYQNQTASEIATQLATAAGLQASVTPTTTPAGRYYEIDHVRLADNISQWTLLNYLAQEEGFDVYVSGNTLYFQPSASGTTAPYTVQYTAPTAQSIQQGNFIDLKCRRSQTLAKDVQVKVVSWNAKQATAFTATAKRFGTGGNPLADTAQVYTFRIPGLTQDQAQQFANARLQEISLHERVIDLSIPGELILQPRQMLAVTGTGTSFDQSYFIDSINRRLSLDEGFVETIRMKNDSPESTVSA